MQTLLDRLKNQIASAGPMSVSEYMTLCLHDPKTGYYATRPGLGTDFITAPEISQFFGELLGLWVAHEWRQLGAPSEFYWVEIGPGRGTLMQDALRAAGQFPNFIAAAKLILVEASPYLRSLQADRLASHQPSFIDEIERLPQDAPIILLANEWLDCLPANQFVRVGAHWYERVIGLSADGELQFGLANRPLEGDFGHLEHQLQAEVQPGLIRLTETLGRHFANLPGRALLIDYGPDNAMPEDTLRAYHAGAQRDPLATPGACDLTVDVDFQRLARLARSQGLNVDGPITQSAFLQALGLQPRLNQIAKAQPKAAKSLFEGAQKLVAPDAMGQRFKVICLSTETLPSATGF